MGVVNCHVTTVDFVLHVHGKMQRTLFDFCSSQTEESDRVSDAGSSLSLVSSDQDPVGDTLTDTYSSTETSTEPSEVTATTCLGGVLHNRA